MALTKEQMAVVKENGIHLTPEDKEQIDSLTIDGELAPDALERIGGGFKISRNTTITLGIILLLGSVAAAGGWAYKNRNRGNQTIGKFPLAIKGAPNGMPHEDGQTNVVPATSVLRQTGIEQDMVYVPAGENSPVKARALNGQRIKPAPGQPPVSGT